MIRAIIFAVFVVLLYLSLLDKTQKATKKEKFTNTVLYHTPIKQYVIFVH